MGYISKYLIITYVIVNSSCVIFRYTDQITAKKTATMTINKQQTILPLFTRSSTSSDCSCPFQWPPTAGNTTSYTCHFKLVYVLLIFLGSVALLSQRETLSTKNKGHTYDTQLFWRNLSKDHVLHGNFGANFQKKKHGVYIGFAFFQELACF